MRRFVSRQRAGTKKTERTEETERGSSLLRFICIALFCFILIGCSSTKERQQRAKDMFNGVSLSASGSLSQLRDMWGQLLDAGNSMADNIEQTVNDTHRRVQQVQSGAKMVLEGKKMLEDGIRGEQ